MTLRPETALPAAPPDDKMGKMHKAVQIIRRAQAVKK